MGSANPVIDALRGTRAAWVHIAAFSSIVNLLMLTGSLYMMQLYDRVLASRSIATLVGVSIIALCAYALQGWLDHIRQKMLGRIGCSVDAALSPLTFRAALFGQMAGGRAVDSLTPFRDLAALRGYLGSLGPTALLDIPFTPLFLAVCFLLHPWLGWLTIGGLLMIVALTVLAERLSAAPGLASTASNAEQSLLIEAGRRNAEAISALGMRKAFSERFNAIHERHVEDTMLVTERSSGLGSFTKMFRFILQSAVLGLGAFLVIRGEMSGGAMLAASIVSARALAPVELAISHLKSFVQARQGLVRLQKSLQNLGYAPTILLPKPSQDLHVEDLAVAPPGGREPIVSRITFNLRRGEAAGLIGPSGSGKSTIARAIAGIWQPLRGEVRFDGNSASQWDPDDLGSAIGYLPQDIELFPGTIAENIARMDPDATADSILSAARAAGAHAMISGFANGYETFVGEGGVALSGGQRQRIALARALFGDPFLVVLDEPNANLDSEGEDALVRAIAGIKARGGIVVVITHRPSGLAGMDKVGLVIGGKLQAFGPRDQILSGFSAVAASPVPVRTPVPATATAPAPAPAPGFALPTIPAGAETDATRQAITLRSIAEKMRNAGGPSMESPPGAALRSGARP